MISGNHIIVDFTLESPEKLLAAPEMEKELDRLILKSGFQILGKIVHRFDSGGYTIVIGLSESHFSIHTWPEKNLGAMDLFISDYRTDNEIKVQNFILSLKEYFTPRSWFQETIRRFEAVEL